MSYDRERLSKTRRKIGKGDMSNMRKRVTGRMESWPSRTGWGWRYNLKMIVFNRRREMEAMEDPGYIMA